MRAVEKILVNVRIGKVTNMTIKNKQELLDYICDLVDKRINEEFHIRAEVAYDLISIAIDEYTNNVTRIRGQRANDVIYNDYYLLDKAISDEIVEGYIRDENIRNSMSLGVCFDAMSEEERRMGKLGYVKK